MAPHLRLVRALALSSRYAVLQSPGVFDYSVGFRIRHPAIVAGPVIATSHIARASLPSSSYLIGSGKNKLLQAPALKNQQRQLFLLLDLLSFSSCFVITNYKVFRKIRIYHRT